MPFFLSLLKDAGVLFDHIELYPPHRRAQSINYCKNTAFFAVRRTRKARPVAKLMLWKYSQQINHYVGQGDINPRQPYPAGDFAVLVKALSQRALNVIRISGTMTAAKTVCVGRITR
jgi:hypothetical protein